jgi:hypothetical protein
LRATPELLYSEKTTEKRRCAHCIKLLEWAGGIAPGYTLCAVCSWAWVPSQHHKIKKLLQWYPSKTNLWRRSGTLKRVSAILIFLKGEKGVCE